MIIVLIAMASMVISVVAVVATTTGMVVAMSMSHGH